MKISLYFVLKCTSPELIKTYVSIIITKYFSDVVKFINIFSFSKIKINLKLQKKPVHINKIQIFMNIAHSYLPVFINYIIFTSFCVTFSLNFLYSQLSHNISQSFHNCI